MFCVTSQVDRRLRFSQPPAAVNAVKSQTLPNVVQMYSNWATRPTCLRRRVRYSRVLVRQVRPFSSPAQRALLTLPALKRDGGRCPPCLLLGTSGLRRDEYPLFNEPGNKLR